jgi:hypothetical protein
MGDATIKAAAAVPSSAAICFARDRPNGGLKNIELPSPQSSHHPRARRVTCDRNATDQTARSNRVFPYNSTAATRQMAVVSCWMCWVT